MKKPSTTRKSKQGKTNGKAPHKPHLPRKLASPSLKKRHKLAVVFQGGSVTERMEKAHLLAEHLALKLYRVDLRPCISRFIGETEKNLDRVFDFIESRETLLYFDEADVLFDKDADAKSRQDRYGNGWIAYFNKRLQSHPGSVLVATNLHTKTCRISRQLKPLVARID
jgi:hypothetical protein